MIVQVENWNSASLKSLVAAKATALQLSEANGHISHITEVSFTAGSLRKHDFGPILGLVARIPTEDKGPERGETPAKIHRQSSSESD